MSVEKPVDVDLLGWNSESMLRPHQHVLDEMSVDAMNKAATHWDDTSGSLSS